MKDDPTIKVAGDRKVVDTTTGEVILDLGDRNSSVTQEESIRRLNVGTLLAGRRPNDATNLPADYHQGPEPYWCPHTGDLWWCRRCENGLQQPDSPKVRKASAAQIKAVQSRSDISWYYTSDVLWSGRDAEGHDWQMDGKTGQIARVYSLNQRRQALELIAEYGLSATARKLDIPRSTLKNWWSRKPDGC